MATGQLDEAGQQLKEAFSKNTYRANLPSFHTLSAELAEKRHQPDSVRYHVRKTLASLTGDEELTNDFTKLTSSILKIYVIY